MPTAAEVADAFTAARKPLEALRAAARDADQDATAAVADAALDDLARRARLAKGADLLTRWTAERACETLTAAGIDAEVIDAAARVDLGTSGRLEVLPAATRNAVPGYRVIHRDAEARDVAEYHAADNPKLAELVGTVAGATAPVVG